MRRGEQALTILTLKVHLMIFSMKNSVMGGLHLHLPESLVQIVAFTRESSLVSRALVVLVITQMTRGLQMRDLIPVFQTILFLVEAIHSDLMYHRALREKLGAPSVKLQVISQVKFMDIMQFYIIQIQMDEAMQGESTVLRLCFSNPLHIW